MADFDVKQANTAADTTQRLSTSNANSSGGSASGDSRKKSSDVGGGKRGNAAIRVLVAVIAAVVIAFCGWSASEYANGHDPLAFLGVSTAVSQAGEDIQPSVGDAGSNSTTPADLTSDEVKEYVSHSLAFSEEDVTVPADDFRVLLKDSGVWVEERSGDDAEAMVRLTAERAAALGSWLQSQGAQTAGVTWITEDAHGVVRVAITDALDVPASGNTSELLAASNGYLIAPETYAALGEVDYVASAGDAPALADGTTIQADTVYTTDANGNVTNATPVSSEQSQIGSSASSKSSSQSSNGQGGSAASGSSQGNSSDGGSTNSGLITVSVSINGSSRTVSVSAGSTALDALYATGASVNAGPNPYGPGTWVYGINGQDQGTSTSHGWTYTVNGSMPSVMSDQYLLSNGDSVSWNFV